MKSKVFCPHCNTNLAEGIGCEVIINTIAEIWSLEFKEVKPYKLERSA